MIYTYPVSEKVNCYDSNLNHVHDIIGWNVSNYFEIQINMIYFQHNVLEAVIKWSFGNHGISASASALTSASTSKFQKCCFFLTISLLKK